MSDSPYHDVATARAARGVRLVLIAGVPSPWSMAAKGLFHVKALPVMPVRFSPRDDELAAWTGARNAPVVVYDDEPPRMGWAEIITLAERLGGAVPLVPRESATRVQMFGLVNELAGEDGLGWNCRLMMVDASLTTGGERGFPLKLAQYLAPRYGHTPARAAAVRGRIIEILTLMDDLLARRAGSGSPYLLGDTLTAADVYAATFVAVLSGISQVECPNVRPELVPAYAWLHASVGRDVPPAVEAHRAMMFERHLPWPLQV